MATNKIDEESKAASSGVSEFAGYGAQVDKTIKSLNDFTESIAITDKELHAHVKVLVELKTALMRGSISQSDYNDKLETYKHSVISAANGAKEKTKVAKELAKAQTKLANEISATKKDLEAYEKGLKSAASAVEKLSSGAAGLSKTAGSMQGAFQGGLRTIGSFVATMSGAAVGLKAAKDQILSYNDSMITMERVARLGDRSIGGLDKAFKEIKKSTTLSKTAFLEFSASMSEAWKGIPPGINALSKLAAGFENAFGANLDQKKRGQQAFQQIQQKWPSIANEVAKSMNLVATIKEDGSGAASAREELAIQQAMIATLAQRAGIEGSNMQALLAMTSELNDVQKEHNALKESEAKLNREVQDQMLQMGKELQGVFIEINDTLQKATALIGPFATAIVSISIAFKSVAVATKGFTVALGGLKVGLAAVMAVAWKFVVIAAAVAAVTKGVMWAIKKFGGESEKAAKGVSKLEQESAKLAKTSAEIVAAHRARAREAGRGAKAQQNSVSRSILKYQELLANYENAISLNKDLNAVYMDQIDILSKMGALSGNVVTEMGTQAIINIQRARRETLGLIDAMLFDESANIMGRMAGHGIKIDEVEIDEADAVGSMRNLIKALNDEASKLEAQIDQETDAKARETLLGRLQGILAEESVLMGQLNTLEKLRNDELQQRIALNNRLADQEEGFNSVMASRLSAERDALMAAQLGMGVSLEMRQREISAANQSLAIAQQRVKEQDKSVDQELESLAVELNLGQAAKQRLEMEIQNANHLGDVRNAINNAVEASDRTLKDQEKVEGAIVSYVVDRAKGYTEIAKHQKTIYDLSRDVREGYIDAVREMMVGNSRMTKLISTQDKNVTQLLDSVKEAHGFHVNTLALGGMQSAEQTARGLGGGAPMRYTDRGLMGQPADIRERITGWRKSMEEAKSGKAGGSAGAVALKREDHEAIRTMGENTRTNSEETTKNTEALEELNHSLTGGINVRPMPAHTDTGTKPWVSTDDAEAMQKGRYQVTNLPAPIERQVSKEMEVIGEASRKIEEKQGRLPPLMGDRTLTPIRRSVVEEGVAGLGQSGLMDTDSRGAKALIDSRAAFEAEMADFREGLENDPNLSAKDREHTKARVLKKFMDYGRSSGDVAGMHQMMSVDPELEPEGAQARNSMSRIFEEALGAGLRMSKEGMGSEEVVAAIAREIAPSFRDSEFSEKYQNLSPMDIAKFVGGGDERGMGAISDMGLSEADEGIIRSYEDVFHDLTSMQWRKDNPGQSMSSGKRYENRLQQSVENLRKDRAVRKVDFDFNESEKGGVRPMAERKKAIMESMEKHGIDRSSLPAHSPMHNVLAAADAEEAEKARYDSAIEEVSGDEHWQREQERIRQRDERNRRYETGKLKKAFAGSEMMKAASDTSDRNRGMFSPTLTNLLSGQLARDELEANNIAQEAPQGVIVGNMADTEQTSEGRKASLMDLKRNQVLENQRLSAQNGGPTRRLGATNLGGSGKIGFDGPQIGFGGKIGLGGGGRGRGGGNVTVTPQASQEDTRRDESLVTIEASPEIRRLFRVTVTKFGQGRKTHGAEGDGGKGQFTTSGSNLDNQ